jgi:2'-5' RNA ligase
MRVFFAIDLAPEVVERVLSVRDRLASTIGEDGVRWVKKAQIHVTLAFLGEQDEAHARAALEVVRPIAEAQERFELSVGGLGAFPDEDRPRVLFLGIDRGAAPLVTLANALTASLAASGFALEQRAFHPHVTLARIHRRRAAKEVSKLVHQGGFEALGETVIDRFALMESKSGPTGATYQKLEELPLR